MPTLPDQLQFTSPLTIEAADENAVNKTPRFKMVAYTGGKMQVAGFPHPVVVDLQGLQITRQDIPVRLDHHPKQGVGHTQRVAVQNNQIIAEGVISRHTSWAKDVAQSGINGFPWQASIGAQVIEAEFVADGQQVKVNGQMFDGPVHVVRQAVLKEISFVDSGADAHTSAKVAAQENTAATNNQKELNRMPKSIASNDVQDTATPGSTSGSVSSDQQADMTASGEDDIQQQEADTTQDSVADNNETQIVEASAANAEDTSDMTSGVTSGGGATSGGGVDEYRRKMAAETRRIEGIRKICGGKYPGVEAKAIEEGWDVTRTELQVLRASRPNVARVASQTQQRSPQVFEATALMAAGMPGSRLEAIYTEPVLEAADRLRGVGVQEFCELACGQRLPRFRRDASGWLQAAFSTTSLPGILSNVANKMLLEGYNYIEDTWRKVCKIASVNDFKEHSRYRMTGSFKFEQVGADGELKHGQLGEQTFGQKADTHGIMFSLTRQMIINDDLAAFTDIPRQIGMGAAEALADAVWGLLLSNPVQSDGKAFFASEHNNYAEGADTALSVDSLTQAEVMFGEQTKPNGRPLGVPANLLLVPTALKVAAAQLMNSLLLNETTTANKPKPVNNPHVGKYDVVSSVYLANASFSGNSAKAWYLLADPNRMPALEVAFLNGVDRPTVEKTDADFNTLGIQFRGYIDFGVREQDYRAALKMKGEA